MYLSVKRKIIELEFAGVLLRVPPGEGDRVGPSREYLSYKKTTHKQVMLRVLNCFFKVRQSRYLVEGCPLVIMKFCPTFSIQ
jgi:hypothetical protein